jgi:hypothetical protein
MEWLTDSVAFYVLKLRVCDLENVKEKKDDDRLIIKNMLAGGFHFLEHTLF